MWGTGALQLFCFGRWSQWQEAWAKCLTLWWRWWWWCDRLKWQLVSILSFCCTWNILYLVPQTSSWALYMSCIVWQGDHLARTLLTYAKNETYNPTTQEALSKFAENFSTVQDYRNAQVHTTVSLACLVFCLVSHCHPWGLLSMCVMF